MHYVHQTYQCLKYNQKAPHHHIYQLLYNNSFYLNKILLNELYLGESFYKYNTNFFKISISFFITTLSIASFFNIFLHAYYIFRDLC